MTARAPDAVVSPPWPDAARQHDALLLGLWLFLVTEVLFFGGLFLFYARARLIVVTGFAAGAAATNLWLGTANTLVLLTSAVTMAMAERALDAGRARLARACLGATVLLGLAFLAIKGFEYRGDIRDHLVPGPGFRFAANGAVQFWSFYWTATVVHAIHLAIGMALVLRLLWVDRRRLDGELTAVYWNLVDVVWVVLYPLLYLAGRAA